VKGIGALLGVVLLLALVSIAQARPEDPWVSLFNGERFDGLEKIMGGEVGCGARHDPVRKRSHKYGY